MAWFVCVLVYVCGGVWGVIAYVCTQARNLCVPNDRPITIQHHHIALAITHDQICDNINMQTCVFHKTAQYATCDGYNELAIQITRIQRTTHTHE